MIDQLVRILLQVDQLSRTVVVLEYLNRSVTTPWYPDGQVVSPSNEVPEHNGCPRVSARHRSINAPERTLLRSRVSSGTSERPSAAQGIPATSGSSRPHPRSARARPSRRTANLARGRDTDHHGDAHGLLPRVVLAEPTVLAVEEPVVRQVDDDGVVCTVPHRLQEGRNGIIERPHRMRHVDEMIVRDGDLLRCERSPTRVRGSPS